MTQKTKKLVLEYPVELSDGSTVRAVMVRAPTPEDMYEVRFDCYARFTGLPRTIIDELDAADIRRLDDLLDAISQCGPRPSKP